MRVAVVGATGAVGLRMLRTLAERNFPTDEVVALASSKSAGKEVSYGETGILQVRSLDGYEFTDTDLALFSAGGSVSAEHAPRACEAGCIVIDNTSHFRMEPDVPLVVPEVNAAAIGGFRKRNIIANPNCSTIQLVATLKPLHDRVPVRRAVVSTYQSVSGAGKGAMEELHAQVRATLFHEEAKVDRLPRRIAFNVIPHIDVFGDDGSTREEWKMVHETKKILGDGIALAATCVRVPVFIGHAEAVNIEFEGSMSTDDARDALDEAEGITVIDGPLDARYATPLDCVNEDAVFVSRIREDPSTPHGLQLWIVADNLGKGAALNSVQIAETLISEYL